MNIFYLSDDLEENARFHVDRHCVKMILEQCQLLSSVHWLNNSEAPYKLTHKNHPCSIWARTSLDNYVWLCKMTLALCKEYTYRYNKIHKGEEVATWHLNNVPNIPSLGITERPKCMDDEYKLENIIDSYRNYYTRAKAHLHLWKNREKPYWIKESV
jgi:hypothetical protein